MPSSPDHSSPSSRAARAADITAGLTRAQKIAMVSGADFWHTKSLDDRVPAIMLTDGPHGLRKQTGSGDHVGLTDSVPATCFPTAVTLGSTWDRELIEQVGAALGREARAEEVAVLLGPGLNLKRHPAGGRAFEYFSEDPVLSGKAAAALVRGIQSEGVGACLKHFAVNNQESQRMRLDTVVDERTLRELYLTGFEIAVTESDPWVVMSAYNLVNGEHAGESQRLITEILRNEWGFGGLVVTDWFATADRPRALHAGVDLEMPSSSGAWDARVAAAIESDTLAESDLDRACARVIDLALRVHAERDARGRGTPVDVAAHHELARRAAVAGTVLLTNDGLLPLAVTGRIALIGAFADHPRYQGSGSSLVNPTRCDTALDALRARVGDDAEVVYAPGYDPATGTTTPALLAQARHAAADADVVIAMVGLPGAHESEGFDRTTLRLPADLDGLVEVVVAANPRTAVVLNNGGPVEIGWADKPAALVEAYLGGQAGGSALVDVLVGDAEPGGRLAESFPVTMAELPSHENFPGTATQVQYRETCNVGYRFHDSFGVAPRFCFGHGLSYTTFEHTDLDVTGEDTDRTVSVTVTNTGDRPGSDVVQVYVHDVVSLLHRPEQELKGFTKVHLEPGEARRVEIGLGRRAFAVFDVDSATWRVEAGQFEIRVGASSRDIRLTTTIDIDSDDVLAPVAAPRGPVATDAEFEVLLGGTIPKARPLMPFHEDSAIDDLREVVVGRLLRALLVKSTQRSVDLGDDPGTRAMLDAVLGQMPLRAVVANSGGKLSFDALDKLLHVLNLMGRRTR